MLPALRYDADDVRDASDDDDDRDDAGDRDRFVPGTDATGTTENALLAARKLAFVERAFVDVEASRSMMAHEVLERCKQHGMTNKEYQSACAERAACGACGWTPCPNAPTRDDGTTQRYEIDGKARKVREMAFVRAFCSRKCMMMAEALGERLGERADAVSAREGAARGRAAMDGEASVVKQDVRERATTAKKAFDAKMPVRKSDAMAKAATVDGYVPKAARKRIEEEREKEKTHRAASITWNEPEIEKIEEELSREKREASGVDPAGGVFYFDTFGEGKKPEGDFVPSIGGRFSEGQLRTEPRTVVDETSRAMENLLLERNDGEDTESHVALEEDVAETTRRMLASKLTATPIPGFVDDGDDDDDDAMTAGSEEEGEESFTTGAPKISQFGLTWMAVDNLVTDATFALVAGDGAFVDKLPPRDRYTVSVSEAWNENLARTIPNLCVTLNISAETRRVEQNLTTLLRTFAFDRPVPAFTSERWAMMALMFIELLLHADLVSKESIGKEVFDNANAIAVFANAGATSEEVNILRERLRGDGVNSN